jgi:hypothetical protein
LYSVSDAGVVFFVGLFVGLLAGLWTGGAFATEVLGLERVAAALFTGAFFRAAGAVRFRAGAFLAGLMLTSWRVRP